jgi:branched-chain amino acid transport system substrate-binding protein
MNNPFKKKSGCRDTLIKGGETMNNPYANKYGRRDVLKLIGASGATLAATSLWGSRAWAEEKTIRVGFPAPLTGPYSAEAKDQVRAAKLAIKQFNDEGGLNGRKAELLVRDGQLSAGVAATRTLDLIKHENVDFIVGALSASVQLAINEVASARGVIYNSISQSDKINEAADFTKYTFHEALNPHMTAGAVGRHSFRKGQKIVFLTADYAFGHEMVRGFKAVVKDVGAEVLKNIKHPIGKTDFSSFMPEILSLKPDVLVISNFGRDQLNSIKQATNYGLKNQMQIVVPVLLYTERLAGGAGPFEDVVGGTNYYWGLEKKVPSAKKFNDLFRHAYGSVPTGYGAYAYSGVMAVLEGAKKAGTTKPDVVIPELAGMKYDYYKGPEYYRKCDHQAVQSVQIIESKKQSEMDNPHDVFKIIDIQPAKAKFLRSCSALGLSDDD